jgi:riboflavin biosynthesis pyrimidine reductase
VRSYGGPLGFREPCVVANFVETLDGVVSIPDVPRSNAVVAAENEADRFVVGLLRACADVVLLGPGTMQASPRGEWQAEQAYPAAAEAFAELRRSRGRPARTAVAVVTSGRSLEPEHPLLARGALVLTTERAAPDLRAAVPAGTEVVAVNDGDRVELGRALVLLRDRGHAVIVSEAGPTVFAQLLAGRLVDELFLTLSPLVAGRAATPRPGLAEGVELLPDVRDQASLVSLRRGGSHLFLRYELG